MRERRVLLAITDSERIAPRVLESARAKNWLVESYDGRVPEGWYGDGVITDASDWRALEKLKDFESIPIVSRRLEHRNNVRRVLGDTRAIAALVADFFIDRGFRDFASFSTHPPIDDAPERIAMVLPDWALKLELERRGFHLRMACLHETPDEAENPKFDVDVRGLRRFLRRLPKPCACFTSNTRNAHLFHRACAEEGVKVPQEIAFLVNNDHPLITEHTRPTTSAIVGEIRQLASRMVETLDAMMAGTTPPVDPIFIKPSGIVMRQSTDILAVPDLKTAQAINFFLTNHEGPISVRDAADHAGLHPDAMNYLFKKHIGKTPGRFLLDLRMDKARKLLTTSKMTLREIAGQIGYGSAMAFSLAFKREHGLTPGGYRSRGPTSVQRKATT